MAQSCLDYLQIYDVMVMMIMPMKMTVMMMKMMVMMITMLGLDMMMMMVNLDGTRCEVGYMLISWSLHHPILLGNPTLQ